MRAPDCCHLSKMSDSAHLMGPSLRTQRAQPQGAPGPGWSPWPWCRPTNTQASLSLQQGPKPPVRDTKVEVIQFAKDLLRHLRKTMRHGVAH